jgi:acetyl-CoA synthetase (ADP-forming)
LADEFLMAPDIAKARALIEASAGRLALTEDDAKQVLACFGLRVPRRVVVGFGQPVASKLDGLEGPFVLKVVAPSILHKSDVGGVKLGLRDATDVVDAIDEMARRLFGHAIDGWLVEEMAPPGPEIVIGATVDPGFGPNVMVGLGGVLVELFEDVCFGICPITPGDAQRMLDSLRGVRLLRGWRGAAPVDEAAVIDALLRIGGKGGLMMALSDLVAELDVNPLIVSARGVMAVDARIVLRGDHG